MGQGLLDGQVGDLPFKLRHDGVGGEVGGGGEFHGEAVEPEGHVAGGDGQRGVGTPPQRPVEAEREVGQVEVAQERQVGVSVDREPVEGRVRPVEGDILQAGGHIGRVGQRAVAQRAGLQDAETVDVYARNRGGRGVGVLRGGDNLVIGHGVVDLQQVDLRAVNHHVVEVDAARQ